MSVANAMMEIRRSVYEANMENEHMPDVVLLFRDHRAKDIFVDAVHRELSNAQPYMAFNGGRVQIAGINLVIGVR